MTPHNKAKKEEIAPCVVMPGDPLRAKWIAENFMDKAVLVSDVRGILAYTGDYKGKRLTVMAHGMGIPSIGIYTYELYHFYDVQTIIRIGSAGSYSKDVNVGDLIIANETLSYSSYAEELGVEGAGQVLKAAKDLCEKAVKTAQELSIKAEVYRTFCSDTFYNKYSLEESIKRAQGAKVVEMEGFALYANAMKHNKKALMLLTCSDSFITHEAMSAEDRQLKFSDMVKLGLETALKAL